MSNVFISYSQEDSDFAAVLMMQLEKAGIDTWIDKSRLRPGADWSTTIDQGIKDAIAMVIVMSPVAKASEYVTYEWSFAVGAGLPVIPILYKKTELHPRLTRHQFLDFTNTSIRPWDELIREIVEVKKMTIGRTHLGADTPEFIRRAAEALDSANMSDRKGGIFTLGEAAERNDIAKEVLIAALDHPLRDVRALAAAHLVDIDPKARIEATVSGLIVGLSHKDRGVKNFTETALKSAKNSAKELLIQCLQVGDYGIMHLAAYQLGELTEKSAVPHLVNLLDDMKMQETAICALGRIGDRSVIPRLIPLLDDPKKIGMTAKVLALLDAQETIPILSKAFTIWAGSNPEQYDNYGQSIAEALCKLSKESITDSIASLVKFDNAFVRLMLVGICGNKSTPQVIGVLSSLLNDQRTATNNSSFNFDPESEFGNRVWSSMGGRGIRVCDAAKDALSKIGTPEAIAAINASGG